MQPLFLHVSAKDQIMFARNIALMTKTGMPLLDAIHMLERQTQSASLKRILSGVAVDIANGQFLSTSLKKYERIFGPLFVNVVRIGETSGTLADNLQFLAEELRKKQELRGKVMSAMLYPIIIAGTTILLTSFIMFFVFPKILPIFDSFTIELPLPTRILIATNRAFLSYWYWFALAAVTLVVSLLFLIRLPKVRYYIQKALLRVPVMGGAMKSIQVAILARTFALLLKSGVKIVEALSITADVMPNLVYKHAVTQAGEQVKIGASLGKYLGTAPHLFPLMFSQMVEVSESAGTLDATLSYLTDYYENEVDEATRNMVTLLEPLLMLVMGVTVGFIAMAIILPIYSISQTFGS